MLSEIIKIMPECNSSPYVHSQKKALKASEKAHPSTICIV